MPLDCEDVKMGLDTIERLKYVRLDDGRIAKRVVIVEGGDPMDCDTKAFGDELRALSTVKVGERQYADLVIIVT